jgi:hypothetical protein
MESISNSNVSRHNSTNEAMLPPSCLDRVIRSLDRPKSSSPVMALAATSVVSCEYLLIPRISFVDGGWAKGDVLVSRSDGWNGLVEELRSSSLS